MKKNHNKKPDVSLKKYAFFCFNEELKKKYDNLQRDPFKMMKLPSFEDYKEDKKPFFQTYYKKNYQEIKQNWKKFKNMINEVKKNG